MISASLASPGIESASRNRPACSSEVSGCFPAKAGQKRGGWTRPSRSASQRGGAAAQDRSGAADSSAKAASPIRVPLPDSVVTTPPPKLSADHGEVKGRLSAGWLRRLDPALTRPEEVSNARLSEGERAHGRTPRGTIDGGDRSGERHRTGH